MSDAWPPPDVLRAYPRILLLSMPRDNGDWQHQMLGVNGLPTHPEQIVMLAGLAAASMENDSGVVADHRAEWRVIVNPWVPADHVPSIDELQELLDRYLTDKHPFA